MSTLRLNKLQFFDSSDSSVGIETGSILTGTAAQFKITGGTANQDSTDEDTVSTRSINLVETIIDSVKEVNVIE